MKKTNIVPALLYLIISVSCVKNEANESSLTKKDLFIDSLISKMTLQEKVGQMNQYAVGAEMTGPNAKTDHAERYKRFIEGEVGSVLNLLGAEETYKLQKMVVDSTRLSIPLIFAYDVIHGYRTIFPLPLAESCSWDMSAIELSARVAAEEASAAGISWTFAPMVDISRDARWGRVMEGIGEDPYLGSLIAKARIKGFQNDDLSAENTIAACVKHLAGYGFVESGKDYNAVNIGLFGLHNYILPPFKASAEAGAATFMNAFNDIDGVPSTSNRYLQHDLLKGKWNFDGTIVSDWNSIGEMINHSVAGNLEQAAFLAVTAGSDIDMEGDAYVKSLASLVNQGKVKETLIDDAVRRILSLKYDLGLFEDPYRYMNKELEKEIVGNVKYLKDARSVAQKSIVLLKNDKDLLPLNGVKKLGIIGPLAKDKDAPLGNWRANAVSGSAVSLYEGLEKRFGDQLQLLYAEGCKLSIGPNNFFQELEIEEDDRSGFAEAVKVARQSDVVIVAMGETAYMSGEARSRADIGLPGLQLELLKEIYKANENVVLVLMNGRPLTLQWEADNVPAIVEAWHLGSEAGHAIADVLSGDYNPSGKLTMSFPRHVGQLPIYYNKLNTGRPESGAVFYAHHMDVENSPLFPFGFGLSYTDFQYLNLEVSVKGEGVEAKVTVVNSGEMAGEEVVQVYIRDLVASYSRPVLELKAFEKVFIEKGQSVDLTFELGKDDLAFLDRDGNTVFEKGEFGIFVGPNSGELVSKVVAID